MDGGYVVDALEKDRFNNIFLEHFIDSKQGFVLFKDIILASAQEVMLYDLYFLNGYTLLSGMGMAVFFVLVMYGVILRADREIKLLSISLSLIPSELQNDVQIISLLKKLEFE